MITSEWSIQGRAERCAVSGEPFGDGEFFYTLLFEEGDAFRREDLSERSFKSRASDGPKPFSLWRAKYEPPPPQAPEPLGKQTAEELLRRFMTESTPQHTNTRYILALMLERKRLLKEVETRRSDGGQITRIYQHVKTGEVFVIPDPGLRLGEIAAVQTEVAALLGP